MSDILTPPEGQTSFSGIPEAHFVEDVDSYMKGEDSAEEKLKVKSLQITVMSLAEIYHTCLYNQ